MIATVRVANPADSATYMTINAGDYRPLVHGPLWEEQAEDFQGVPPPPVISFGQAERDFAGALMLDVFAFEMQREGRDFNTLSPAERMLYMRDKRQEFVDHRDRYLRESVAPFGVKPKIIPGETPGHPVDAVSGKPMHLTDEQRASLANIMLPQAGDGPAENGVSNIEGQAGPLPQEPGRPELVALDTAPAEPLPPLAETPEAPAGNETPAPAPGAAPAWASAPAPAPATEAVKAEKGPGGKWYVKRGKEVLSQGFATKAEAEADLPNHEAK